MEHLYNGFTLELSPGAFPLSTDSMALSGFIKLPRQANVLDLGSGCGTLGLLLCATYSDCQVTGIELDAQAHQMALDNANRNGVASRLNSICADLNTIPAILPPGQFHVCVSNPPYFSAGPQSQTLPLARREDVCSLENVFSAAAWSLRYGGDFFLVHRPERLAKLCACGTNHKLEPKRLCFLRHRTDGPISLVLLQCRKGGKPGLILEEESFFTPQGEPTDYYRKLYHL